MLLFAIGRLKKLAFFIINIDQNSTIEGDIELDAHSSFKSKFNFGIQKSDKKLW